MNHEAIMKNTIVMNLRAFPIKVHDHRDGKEKEVIATVSTEQLHAASTVGMAQTVGKSRIAFLERLCEDHGYTALEIGKAVKFPIPLDLGRMTERYIQGQSGERVADETDAGPKAPGLYGELTLENQAKMDALALELLAAQEAGRADGA